MRNEISFTLSHDTDKMFSPFELELGEIVSTEYPEDTTPNDLRLVTSKGLFSLSTGVLWAAKDHTDKYYHKLPTGTVIKLITK